MASTRTRQEAYDRICQDFFSALDRIIPLDESKPLKGQTLRDFELQARELKEAIIPTLLEERAVLSAAAQMPTAGRCPSCGSERTYLESAVRQRELRSPGGPVVLSRQDARCRACNRSFSPSGS